MSTRFALTALLSLLAACTTPGASDPVQVEHAPGFDASAWRSFAWRERTYEDGMTRDANPRLERLVRDEVARTLGEKGYREMAAADADFALTYGAAVSISYRTDPRTGETLRGGSPDWVPSYTVREGTLALQVVDAAGRTVWIGSTQATVVGPPPEGRDEAVRAAVARILARFPDAAP